MAEIKVTTESVYTVNECPMGCPASELKIIGITTYSVRCEHCAMTGPAASNASEAVAQWNKAADTTATYTKPNKCICGSCSLEVKSGSREDWVECGVCGMGGPTAHSRIAAIAAWNAITSIPQKTLSRILTVCDNARNRDNHAKGELTTLRQSIDTIRGLVKEAQ